MTSIVELIDSIFAAEGYIFLYNIILSLVIPLGAWIIYQLLKRIIKRQIKDVTHRHSLRALMRNMIFVVAIIMIILVWLRPQQNLTVVIGLAVAGIILASQSAISSFSGYLLIISTNIYGIGDRISINNVTGDVMDIGFMRTTIMEIGQWVKADQYTGRVVTISNKALFDNPVFNYTRHWGYLWDEIMIPVTYTSDWRRTADIMLDVGNKYTAQLQEDAEAKLVKLIDRFPLKQTKVEPTIYFVMTDNWIEITITLRFVMDAQEGRKVKAQLNRELLQQFEEEENITIASATFDIVGFPAVQRPQGQS
jgi:small-conductance mechanosensitive channel